MGVKDTVSINKIITIPNILSLFRLLLIPVFCVVYLTVGDYKMAASVLILSGITDVVDGFIARKYDMVSNVGKVLDPIADKLTQIAVLACLISRFKHMLIPCILLAGKEFVSGIAGLIALKKTKVVCSAEWHGKLTTTMLYSMMVIHILWYDIHPLVSNISIGLCVAVMLMSFVLYSLRNIKMITGKYTAK